MSLFAMIPPLMSVGKLLQTRWESLFAFLKTLPGLFRRGVKFLLTGIPNPWPENENCIMPQNPISIPALERYWLGGKLAFTYLNQ